MKTQNQNLFVATVNFNGPNPAFQVFNPIGAARQYIATFKFQVDAEIYCKMQSEHAALVAVAEVADEMLLWSTNIDARNGTSEAVKKLKFDRWHDALANLATIRAQK